MIYDLEVLRSAVNTLPSDNVFFVGIRCDLEIAEQREQERGNRAPGGARAFYPHVHADRFYDLEVDSGIHTAAECADLIKVGLAIRTFPTAFNRLRQSESS